MKKILKYLLKKLFFKYSHKIKDNSQPMVIFNDWIGKNIILNGFYEKETVDTIIKSLDFNPGKYLCIDVGANIGYHTLQFQKYFKKIIGFEPQNKTFQILKLNTENYLNISIYNFGIAQKDDLITFYIPHKNIGSASQRETRNSHYKEKVKLKNYDKLFDQECSYIKIDVEGNELDVIKGMKNTIINYKPVISFEMRDYDNKSKLDLLNTLKELGYIDFYVPKEHFIEDVIKSTNLLALLFKRMIILFYNQKNEGLSKINILNQNKDYSLITTFNIESKFKIKFWTLF